MIAVDTNVLVRVLIDDAKQPHQVKVARQFAKKAAKLFVPQIVQVELVWVLAAAYHLDKPDILSVLHHLEENEAFELQNESVYAEALTLYQISNADFSDCLILVESRQKGCRVTTFDKKFSRLEHVDCLELH